MNFTYNIGGITKKEWNYFTIFLTKQNSNVYAKVNNGRSRPDLEKIKLYKISIWF